MDEVKNDWIMDDKKRALFWVGVKDHLGHLDDPHAAAHAACAVTSMKLFEGTLDDALRLVMEFAAADAEFRDAQILDGIKTISVTYERKFNLGDYESLNIGMTTWADVPDGASATDIELKLWQWVKDAVKREALPVIKKQPVSRTTPATKPDAVQKPSPAPSAPSGVRHEAPPAPQRQSEGEQMEQAEFIKITAPKGKPVIEFWRPVRKWPELKYNLSAESFFENVVGADQLIAKGYTVEQFADVGQEYTIPMNVFWEVSPNSPEGKVWKDITRIELR